MKLLFLSWRDIKAPKKGGAEVFTHEMLARVDHENFDIIHFSPLYKGGLEEEIIDGVKYIRKGNILSVIYHAFAYYRKHRHTIDYVVDQCNTHRFFTPLWVKKQKRIFFIHQLTRELWLRNWPLPFSYVGYYLENTITRIYKNNRTLTVSQSTLEDLLAMGFKEERIAILPEGIDFIPWMTEAFAGKADHPIFTYVGRYAKYKGIDQAIEAFGMIKEHYPQAIMWIVGKENESFKEGVIQPVLDRYHLEEGKDIIFHGFVSDEEKLLLMSKSHAMLFASVREGWGLTITEAAAVGTPSIVFNSPGLIDAVAHGAKGYLVDENSPEGLMKKMLEVIEKPTEYQTMRMKAYDFSKRFHWQATADAFASTVSTYDRRRQ